MAVKFTEKDLQRCGLQVDPQDPTQIVPIEPEAMPDETWDLHRLAVYAATGISEAGQLRAGALQMARKSTVQIYRAGRALHFARLKKKADRGWVQWLKDNNIPRTTAWEALELFMSASSEEDIADLTRTQAKKKYGIIKGPRAVSSGDSGNRPPASKRSEVTDNARAMLSSGDQQASVEQNDDDDVGEAEGPSILALPALPESAEELLPPNEPVPPLVEQATSIRDGMGQLIEDLLLDQDDNDVVRAILEEISEMVQKGLDALAAKPEVV